MVTHSTRIVLGGGLGGLSAAYYLAEAFPSEKIKLYESSQRTGGWIKTVRSEDGTFFEQGPRTIRPKGEAGKNTLRLVETLGLQNDIFPITSKHPAATKRMIYVNGKLHTLPSSLLSMFKNQTPFSKPLFMHLLNDIRVKKGEVTKNDESIYDFTSRRFGREVADYLISPMICGICAGNAKHISVKFLMETLFNYEQKHGSITKGVLSNIFFGSTKKSSEPPSNLCNRANKEKWSIYSFRNGMETLPKALESYLLNKNVEMNLSSHVEVLEISSTKANIKVNSSKDECNHIISSLPAPQLASLIKQEHPKLAKLLESIQMVSVAVVNLKYKNKMLKEDAFGFLTAPSENVPVLGVIYDSCCFPSGEYTILTAMMGGFWFEKYFGPNPEKSQLLSTAKTYINKILGIKENPIEYQVNILHNCIPQYNVGHHDIVNSIEHYILQNKLPLSICGSSYYGVGVNDVILSAKKAVSSIAH